jgi:transposase
MSPPAPAPAGGPAPSGALPPLTFTRAIELLDTIPGVNQRGAEMIVAEIGIDMARFGTASRLAAWSGVAPGNDESAGKRRSGKTRKGNQVLRAGLTQLAHGAVRTKGTYVSALYRRLAARRGKRRASSLSPTPSWSVSFICSPAMNRTVNWGPAILTSDGGITRSIG